MGNLVFNIAKGRAAHYATLPAASDALVVVPIESAGIESDAVLKDYDDLASLLASTNNEQTTMGRKLVSASVTVTVDDVNDWVDVDMPDQIWIGVTGNPISALLVCYDADTGAGGDANIIPLTKHDFVSTPDGTDIVGQVETGGFYRAS